LRRSISVMPSASSRSSSTERISEPSCARCARFCACSLPSTLTSLLEPLQPYFGDPGVEEIIVNRPGEVWVWRAGAFERHEIALDADDIIDIGTPVRVRRHDHGAGECPA